MQRSPLPATLFPYTTLFRSAPGGRRLTRVGRTLARFPLDPRMARMLIEAHRLGALREVLIIVAALSIQDPRERPLGQEDRKSTRLNSSHVAISYAVFCLKKKKKKKGAIAQAILHSAENY